MKPLYGASGAMINYLDKGQDDQGPRIQKLETFTNQFIRFVKVTTEDGQTGWGQVATYNSDITCQILHRQISPWAIGWGVDALEQLVEVIPLREHKFSGTYICRALAGLDTAVWDLRGKMEDKPVVELLGGTLGSLRASASSMRRDIKPGDEADRLLRLQEQYGFDALKVRVGAECANDRDEWAGRTEKIIPQMRKLMSSGTALLADANSGFTSKRAIFVGRMLEDFEEYFEEPCSYWEIDQTAEVSGELDISVAGGEQDFDLRQWKRIRGGNTIDIVQPDILYLGGVCRTMQVVEMASKAGLTVTPHCANLSLVTLFTMHLLKAISNAGKYLAFLIEGPDYYPWQSNLFTDDPFKIEDGRVEITDLPGWGVSVHPDWLSCSTYQISEKEN